MKKKALKKSKPLCVTCNPELFKDKKGRMLKSWEGKTIPYCDKHWLVVIEKNAEHRRHRERHKILHRNLDELLADFVATTDRMPSKTSLVEFLHWSYQQTLNPTDRREVHST